MEITTIKENYSSIELTFKAKKWQFLALKINSLEDVETYDKVIESLTEVKTTLNLLEEKRKEIKAPILLACANIDKEAKLISDEINVIKLHLDTEKIKFDKLKNAEKIRIEAEKKELLTKRIAQLESIGFKFEYENQGFKRNEVFYTISNVQNAKVDSWDNWFEKEFTSWQELVAELELVEKARIEKEKRIEDERLQIEKERESLRKEREELEKQRVAIPILKGTTGLDKPIQKLEFENKPTQSDNKPKLVGYESDSSKLYLYGRDLPFCPDFQNPEKQLISEKINRTITKIKELITETLK
jgi:hypothetical protein